METEKLIFNCTFEFETDPVDQLFAQIKDGAKWENGLVFDLNISGINNEGVYFVINRIDFSDFLALVEGIATIELETSLRPPYVFDSVFGKQETIDNFILMTNDVLILVDSQGESDTIGIEFSAIKIDFDNPITNKE